MAVTYGPISFAYCQTELNSAGAEMDPSGSDQKFTAMRLRIRAHLNPALYPNLNFGNKDPAAVLAAIRHYMTLPRQALYYDLLSPPYQKLGPAIIDLPDGRDDANGPIPDPDAFSAVYTTPNNIEITWSVIVKLRDCGDSNVMPLSFRWETGVTFDKYWKATYRQTGYVLFSSLSRVTVDNFRRANMAPQVLPGFAREKADYKVSADGLRCDFEFVDGQIRWGPPPPCVDMDIVQSESFPLPGGKRVGELTVAIRGMLNANPVDLEYWCMVVGFGRLQAADPVGDRKTGRLIGQAVFSTHETKDSVDATFTISYMVNLQTQGSELRTTAASQIWNFVGDTASSLNPTGTPQPVGGGGGPPSGTQVLTDVTQQGRITAKNQPFPWVGYGTTPNGALNPMGYATWAMPTAAMSGPEGGFSLASALVLYAAILRDPCGGRAYVMPNAQQVATTVNPNPATWNTIAAGRGGATPTTGAQLTASLTGLTAAQTQTTPLVPRTDSPYADDPRPGVYDLWQCSAEYNENPGVIVVPTSDPNGRSVKIRFASTQWTLRLRWIAKRTGSWPLIPPRVLTDSNWVYTNSTTPVREMRMGGDSGSYIYEASGVYEFMALDPSQVQMIAAVPPTLSTTALAQVGNWASLAAQGILTGNAAAINPIIPDPMGGGSSPALISGGGSPLGSGILPGSVPP